MSDAHALLHTAGELMGIAVDEILQPDLAQEGASPHRVLGTGQALDVDRQQNVAQDGAPGKEHGLLENHPDVLARTFDRRPFELHSPCGLGQDAGQQLEKRALAASAGTDDGHELAVGHAEPDVPQRLHGAGPARVELAQPLHPDQLLILSDGAHTVHPDPKPTPPRPGISRSLP
jgi:hypothetical protein